MISFRSAQPSDYERICRLVQDADELFRVYPNGRFPLTVAQLETLARERSDLTVMLDDGEIVGFANLYELQKGDSAFIGNVIVARTHRGIGLGRMLIEKMIATAVSRHAVEQIHISVFNDNTPALLLYASIGFVPYAVEPRTTPDGRRLALVHLKLDAMDRRYRQSPD